MPQFDVRLDRVSKSFGGVKAIDAVSLEVARGEFLSLLGPSGCGKTTILRTIAGFETPDAGEVYIRDLPVKDVPPYRRNLGMVFQSYALFPHMTIFDNVAFGLRMRGVPAGEIGERVREAMALVKLESMERRIPSQLSGGQQQRVALARSLVTRPAVLLLDESLSALDKKLREQMQVELKELQRRLGITTIFVTHDQEEALTMSDRIAIMDQGHIVQLGSPTEIYERPGTRFAADFIGLSNFLSARVRRTGPDARVELPGSGQIPVPSLPAGCTAGDAVEVAVRPEKVVIQRGEPQAGNWLSGRIQAVIYLGTATHYYVTLPGDQQVIAFCQNQTAAESFAQNDVVYVTWPPESSLVFAPPNASGRN